jgi:adenosylhomocysteine nucleosidase
VAQGIEGLVSWGCAAALQDTLLPGTLLLPERIRCVDGLEHAVDHDWHAAVKGILEAQHAPRTETLIESTVVVASAKDKRSLHETSGAYAVDMESAAVARVAASNALPFLVIRSVADPARLDFPPALLKALNPRGDVRMGALLAGLLQRPRAIPELMTLGRHFGSAMKTLDSARSLLGDDFQYPKNRSTPS